MTTFVCTSDERHCCYHKKAEEAALPPVRSEPMLTDALWKVHTANLLTEIVQCSGQPILEKPVNILGKLLAAVGERAAELNDPKLNALMCRLTIYTIADPQSPDYDPDAVANVMRKANAHADGSAGADTVRRDVGARKENA